MTAVAFVFALRAQRRALLGALGSHNIKGVYSRSPTTALRVLSSNLPSQSPITRDFSTFQASNSNRGSSKRAYPQYTIYGDEAALSLKLISPTFKSLSGGALLVDPSQRGRLLLEFALRDGGRFLWTDVERFALSAEEVGLICAQVPKDYTVELVRSPLARELGETAEERFADIASNEMPEKVLQIAPGSAGTVEFQLDYILDGVGGQSHHKKVRCFLICVLSSLTIHTQPCASDVPFVCASDGCSH